MEVYHRDYWIINVHMATWNDLTKGNEGKTMIDWIDHMESFIKHVLCELSL